MNMKSLKLLVLSFSCMALSVSVLAQNQSSTPSGSETFSPYTPAQIQQFNQQSISPAEGPFGPVDPSARQTQKPRFDSQYFSAPVGEQEAEAIETESAQPYEPIPATIRF
jgi:hypothetical protein